MIYFLFLISYSFSFPLNLIFSIIKNILSYEHIEIILIILGWFIVYKVTIKSNRVQQRHNINVKIYENILLAKEKLDKSIIELNSHLREDSLPWFYMEQIEKNGSKEYATPGLRWLEYTGKISESYFNFVDHILEFENIITTWRFNFKELDIATDILLDEFYFNSNEIFKSYSYLSGLTVDEPNWNNWDKERINSELFSSRDLLTIKFIHIPSDYLDLIYKSLMYPIFKIKRELREDFIYDKKTTEKVLTINGYIEKEFSKTKNRFAE